MTPRTSRTSPAPATRAPVAPVHRGPQALPSASPAYGPQFHAPNAALLIDFDNVTMGIRSDLGKELRSLLSSDIIKGKVAVQRAYADWRRYPQYIVPLTEASIDLIYAPAYGASKKNATDIRLAIDALELVFTRSEIGTFILLSGDSDFSSLVIKLKEYGKYVIGVGIRESSSDLLVMNCDEYYSYNALAGLVKSNEDEVVKWDPWELVTEAVQRMKRNGDVMRSDRLKQVMQEIDSTFDEKNLGMAKFSRFTQEAAQRGLLKVTKLDNGQMEVNVPGAAAAAVEAPRAPRAPVEEERANGGDVARRGRRGRGRGRGRERAEQPAPPPPAHFAPALEEPVHAPAASPAPRRDAEMQGERLTREEAFDLVRRAVAALTSTPDEPVPASEVRRHARDLLGRDSESLSERFFTRILQDAHGADIIDLRRRGDDYEVAPAAAGESVQEQLALPVATAEMSQAARSAAHAAALRRGIRGRGGRGRLEELPPELLTLGVVEEAPAVVAPAAAERAPEPPAAEEEAAQPRARRGRKTSRGRGRKSAEAEGGEAEKSAPRRSRPRKKSAASSGDEG